jgi:hypothetical protein
MARKFFTSILAKYFNAAGDAALQIGLNADTQPRLQVDAGGALRWGPGGSTAVDTVLQRSAAGVLNLPAGGVLADGLPMFCQTFTIMGTLVVGTGAARFYFPRPITIVDIEVSVGTAPTGASVIFDVNKNGTTIFTTQGNRPTIAVSTNTDLSSTPDITTYAAGDYMTVDVDQIGSTIAGANATITIWYR